MIYYYTNNEENYLRDGWVEYPHEYTELQEKIEFPFKEYFSPVLDVNSKQNFVWFFELRHPFVLKNLDKYKIPNDVSNAIKEKRCKILVLGWMENWGSKEFEILYSSFKTQIPELMHEDFVYATASLEDYSKEKFNHYYANRMERQWHEVFYKKIERKRKTFQKVKDFICLNRRPAWHRFLTISLLWEYRHMGYLSHLAKDSKLNDSYYGTETAEDHYEKALEVFEACDPWPKIASKKFKKQIEKALPLTLKHDKYNILNGDNPNKDTDAPKYLESWIHVVTETRMEAHIDENTWIDRFVSEKTFKPMFYKQFFVLVGQYKTLEALKKLGYKTFDTLFNENYDKKKNPYFRTMDALENIKRWLQLNETQKQNEQDRHQPIFEHNFQNLIRRGKEFEEKFHDHIMETFNES